MTESLEKAFVKASSLPVSDQNILPQSLLDDLNAEELWDATFVESQDELQYLRIRFWRNTEMAEPARWKRFCESFIRESF